MHLKKAPYVNLSWLYCPVCGKNAMFPDGIPNIAASVLSESTLIPKWVCASMVLRKGKMFFHSLNSNI